MRNTFVSCLIALEGMLAFLGAQGSAVAEVDQGEVFALSSLPPGKDITLGHPATTKVPLNERVQLGATDAPQTLSFKVKAAQGHLAKPIQVAIYDAHQSEVQYLTVHPQQTALYLFKGLSTIMIVPSVDKGGGQAQTWLQVASDKPLKIAH